MRSRVQILVAVLVAGLMVAGGTFLDRQVGLRTRSQLPRSSVTSGAWFCPHGGGPKGWNVTLEVANPGQSAVTIRVTSIGDGKPGLPASFTVEPGSTLAVPASADGRAASSTVEYFGGWVAVGWVSRAGGGESGVAAEPCTERTASRWFAPDGDTTEGQDAYLIVMNPFSAKAIFDVVVTTTDQAPVRTSDLTDVPLSPDRAVAIHLNGVLLDRDAVSAEVDVKRGRVAVASLEVSAIGGVRSAIGHAGDPQGVTYLPVAGRGGQSTLVVMVPGTSQALYDATLLSSQPPAPAGGLTQQEQSAQSSRTYPVLSQGASSVNIATTGAPVVAIRRVAGLEIDTGATGGVNSPAAAWVVTPTVACDVSRPGLALSNPGGTPVVVVLHLLPRAGEPAPPDATVQVPPGSTVGAPADFLAADPAAAVLVTTEGGTIVAAGTSSSCGRDGSSSFAVAVGVPVPEGALP